MRGCRPLQFSFVVGLLFSISATSHAESPKKPGNAAQTTTGTPAERLGTVDAWTAYAYSEKSGKACYLAGEPKKSERAGVKRKPPMAMITRQPDENIANVVSFVSRYALTEGSN